MTNILIECPDLIASVKVGVLNSLEALVNDGRCCMKFIKTLDIKKADIQWADIVIIVRGCEPVTLNVARAAKKTGRLIVYFLDDDLLNVPKDVSCSAYFEDKSIRYSMKEILALSDVLWYVNPLIGKLYGEYFSGRHLMTRIAIKTETDHACKSREKTINILYAGSIDHEPLINKYLRAPIEYITDKYGDKVTFTFVGADPHITGNPGVRFHSYFADYEQYSSFIRNGNFIIGLAPSETSRFYQCKYLNKFIEYTRFGIVGIYTNSMPYTMEVVNDVNGFLTENTPEKWREAIEHAIESRENLLLCKENAVNLVKAKFNSKELSAQLLEELPEIVSFKAPDIKTSCIKLPSQFWCFAKQRISMLWEEHHMLAIFYIIVKAAKFSVKRMISWSERIVKKLFHRNI